MNKFFFKWFLAVVFVLVLFQVGSMANISQAEHDALMDLYNNTGGANWNNRTNWGGPLGTENTWYGVVTDAGNTMVLEINLEYNNLQGTLPVSLNNLTNLTKLDFAYNGGGLTGNIPDLSALTNLQYFDLYGSYNLTAGPIPNWILNSTTLTNLGLYYTNRNGTIPAGLNNLTNLQFLDLGENGFTGDIPDLSALTSLTYFDIGGYDNNFNAAPVPTWITGNHNWTDLGLYGCNLTGTIPDFSALTNLQFLNLGRNNFTGDIPDLSALTNLNCLSLSYNWNLNSGPIPDWIFSLTNLQTLGLAGTNRTGAVPSAIGNLTNLHYLALDYNQLASIPTQIGNLTNLNGLYLSGNQLTSIPTAIGNLTNLNYLYLDCNQLTSIPPEIGNLTNLNVLYLNNNQLTSIPPEIADLTNLNSLQLGENQLTSIPTQIGNLTNLHYLYFEGNAIVGSVPSWISNLTNLYDGTGLDIRWNGFYTSDPSLIAFLNQKQNGGNWQSTQTVAPTNVSAGNPTINSITVSWTPITYTADGGGYKVYYSTAAGGPYTLKGITSDKTISSMVVDGLLSDTTYYFVVQSVTNPHANNQNTVESGFSAEVSATTIYVCPQIVIYPNSFPDGVRMKPYNQTLISNNGTAPYTYSITSGHLPNGMSLNSTTGVISGTPSLLGTFSFTLKVLDARGCNSSKTYSIKISTSASLPPPVPDGSFGNALSMTRLTNDGSQIAFNYDTNSCRANAYSIYYGNLSSVSSCTFSGSVCSIDTDGTYDWTSVPAGNLFFIIVSNNGNGTEGSWGKSFINGSYSERGGTTPSNLCSNTLHSNDGICE